MLQVTPKRSNAFGLASILISFSFWVFVYAVPWLPFLSKFKIPIGVPATILFAAFLLGLIAVFKGSKWWIVALVLPLYGAVFLLSLRT